KENIYPSRIDDRLQATVCAGMEYRRATDKQDFFSGCMGILHGFCNGGDYQLFRPLCGDAAVHESKGVTLIGTVHRLNPDSLIADDNKISLPNMVHRGAARCPLLS